MRARFLFLLLLLVGVVGCRGGGTGEVPREELAQNNRQFIDAFNNRDVQRVAESYTQDAKVMPPNMLLIEGRDGVRNLWQQVIGAGFRNLNLETALLERHGDIIIELGRYSMDDAQGQSDRGKYAVVWKEEEGRWKMYIDTWSSDMPPPGQAGEQQQQQQQQLPPDKQQPQGQQPPR